jgi:Domain of unknown function (DUF4395)
MERNGNRYRARRNFILQQGLSAPSAESCPLRYSALMFQPRVVGVVVLAAVLLQSGPIFLALSAVLWWNALLPRWNPFDAVYNRLFASRTGTPLAAAPPPRRFAQGMAGSFALAIGGSLRFGWTPAAHVLEALMLCALGALVLGRFCLGSFLFHLARGEGDFATRTLPWRRND